MDLSEYLKGADSTPQLEGPQPQEEESSNPWETFRRGLYNVGQGAYGDLNKPMPKEAEIPWYFGGDVSEIVRDAMGSLKAPFEALYRKSEGLPTTATQFNYEDIGRTRPGAGALVGEGPSMAALFAEPESKTQALGQQVGEYADQTQAAQQDKYKAAVEAMKAGNTPLADKLLAEYKAEGGVGGAITAAGVGTATDPAMLASLGKAGLVLGPGIAHGAAQGIQRAYQVGKEKGFTSPEFGMELPETLLQTIFAAQALGHAPRNIREIRSAIREHQKSPTEQTQRRIIEEQEAADLMNELETIPERTKGDLNTSLKTAADILNKHLSESLNKVNEPGYAPENVPTGEYEINADNLAEAPKELPPGTISGPTPEETGMVSPGQTLRKITFRELTPETALEVAKDLKRNPKYADKTPEELAQALLTKTGFTVSGTGTVYIGERGLSRLLQAKNAAGIAHNISLFMAHEADHVVKPTAKFMRGAHDRGEGVNLETFRDAEGIRRSQALQKTLLENPEFQKAVEALMASPETQGALRPEGLAMGAGTYRAEAQTLANELGARGLGPEGRQLTPAELAKENKAAGTPEAESIEEDNVTVAARSALDKVKNLKGRERASALKDYLDRLVGSKYIAKGDRSAVVQKIKAGLPKEELPAAPVEAAKGTDLEQRIAAAKADAAAHPVEPSPRQAEVDRAAEEELARLRKPPGYAPEKLVEKPKFDVASVVQERTSRWAKNPEEVVQRRLELLKKIREMGGVTADNLARLGITKEQLRGFVQTIDTNRGNKAYDPHRAILRDPAFRGKLMAGQAGGISSREVGLSKRGIERLEGTREAVPPSVEQAFVSPEAHLVGQQRITRGLKNAASEALRSKDPSRMREVADKIEAEAKTQGSIIGKIKAMFSGKQAGDIENQRIARENAVRKLRASAERRERGIAREAAEKEHAAAMFKAAEEAKAAAKIVLEKFGQKAEEPVKAEAEGKINIDDVDFIEEGLGSGRLSAAEAIAQAKELAKEVKDRGLVRLAEAQEAAHKQAIADARTVAKRDTELGAKKKAGSRLIKKGEVLPQKVKKPVPFKYRTHGVVVSAGKAVEKLSEYFGRGPKTAPGEVAAQAQENLLRGAGQGRVKSPRKIGQKLPTPVPLEKQFRVEEVKRPLSPEQKEKQARIEASRVAAKEATDVILSRAKKYEFPEEARPAKLTEGKVTRVAPRPVPESRLPLTVKRARTGTPLESIKRENEIIAANATKLADLGEVDPKAHKRAIERVMKNRSVDERTAVAIVDAKISSLREEAFRKLVSGNKILTRTIAMKMRGMNPAELRDLAEEARSLSSAFGAEAGTEKQKFTDKDTYLKQYVKDRMESLKTSLDQVTEKGNLHTLAEHKASLAKHGKGGGFWDFFDEFMTRGIDPNQEYYINKADIKRFEGRLQDAGLAEYNREFGQAEEAGATARPELAERLRQARPLPDQTIPRGTTYRINSRRPKVTEAIQFIHDKMREQGIDPYAGKKPPTDIYPTGRYPTYEGMKAFPHRLIFGGRPMARGWKHGASKRPGFESTLEQEAGGKVVEGAEKATPAAGETLLGKVSFRTRQPGKATSPMFKALLGKGAQPKEISDAIALLNEQAKPVLGHEPGAPRIRTPEPLKPKATVPTGTVAKDAVFKIRKMAETAKHPQEFSERLDSFVDALVDRGHLTPGEPAAKFRRKAMNYFQKARAARETPRQTAERVLGGGERPEIEEIEGGRRPKTIYEEAGEADWKAKPMNERVEVAQKVIKHAEVASGMVKAGLTGMDVSNPFRQTLFLTGRQMFHHPKQLYGAMKEMFTSYGEARHRENVKELQADPAFSRANDAGIAFSHEVSDHDMYTGADVMAHFLDKGRKFSWKNPVKWAAEIGDKALIGAGRAYTQYQNRIMLDTFKAGESYLRDKGQLNAKSVRELVDMINMFGSRSRIKTKSLGRVGNVILFSPQMIKSRLKAFAQAGLPFETEQFVGKDLGWLLSGGKRYETKAVREFGHSTVRSGATLAAGLMALTYGAAVAAGQKPKLETDPRSTDFAKIRIGHTTVNPLGDWQQYIRVGAQLLTEKEKLRGSGRVQKANRAEIVSRMVRGKLSPAAGLFTTLFTGKTGAGREAQTLAGKGRALKETVTPLMIGDIIDITKENPNALAPLLIAFSAAGIGVQAGTPGKPWIQDYEQSQTDVRVSDEISRLKLEPPRVGTRVPLRGKNALGQPLYYSLKASEREEFENKVMPIISKDLDKIISSERYQKLPENRKRRFLYNIIKRENIRYSVAKKLRKQYAGEKPANAWWDED